MKKTPKLAIICAAGGTSCAYSGGALVALAKEQQIYQPDYLIAASGSAGSAIYYLTEQYESIRRTWTEHICSPHFISYKRLRKMMDVDYLVDTIIRKMEPLDLDKLAVTRTRYFIPVKSATTGEGRYFSCRENFDIHEVLRATKALQFFYRKKVFIDGDFYVDSAFKLTKEHGVSKALELGATHILVIETNSRKKTRLKSFANKTLSYLGRAKSIKELVNCGAEILRLGPDINPAPPVTRNPKRLLASFEKGYDDVRDHGELREFLKPFIAPEITDLET